MNLHRTDSTPRSPNPLTNGARIGRVGVIDIGSNSIRLVVFEGHPRAPYPVFNEKVLCGLGRGLDATGRLDPDGVALALESGPLCLSAGRHETRIRTLGSFY